MVSRSGIAQRSGAAEWRSGVAQRSGAAVVCRSLREAQVVHVVRSLSDFDEPRLGRVDVEGEDLRRTQRRKDGMVGLRCKVVARLVKLGRERDDVTVEVLERELGDLTTAQLDPSCLWVSQQTAADASRMDSMGAWSSWVCEKVAEGRASQQRADDERAASQS
jgi:hypothetical protein